MADDMSSGHYQERGREPNLLAAVSPYSYLQIIYRIQSRLPHSLLRAEVDVHRCSRPPKHPCTHKGWLRDELSHR